MSIDWVSVSAVSNILIALVTLIALLYTWRSNNRARELTLLREKLYFYSGLMAGTQSSHKTELKEIKDVDYQMRWEFFTFLREDLETQKTYSFLAEPELAYLLKEIMPTPRDLSHAFDSVEEQVAKAILCTHKDFEKLTKKYYDP